MLQVCKNPRDRCETGLFHRNSCQRGFSLIELLVVVAIIGILVTLVSPMSFKFYDKMSYRATLLQLEDLKRKVAYEAFIREKLCELSLPGGQEQENSDIFELRCDKKLLLQEPFYFSSESLQSQIKLKLPIYFNAKGIEIRANKPKDGGR